MTEVPSSHPRYRSLVERERIVRGMEEGYVARQGLIAQGRGEAYDYLIGEQTISPAERAERTAVAMMMLANHPVMSVNGNVAALCPKDVVELAGVLGTDIEINLFYDSPGRREKIMNVLREAGASNVMGGNATLTGKIQHLDSRRGDVDPSGILDADIVFVPLEDGDRTEALVNEGKGVIAVDLNPMSRTARTATVSICDNVTRALPNMAGMAREMQGLSREELKAIVDAYDNGRVLEECEGVIRSGLGREGK